MKKIIKFAVFILIVFSGYVALQTPQGEMVKQKVSSFFANQVFTETNQDNEAIQEATTSYYYDNNLDSGKMSDDEYIRALNEYFSVTTQKSTKKSSKQGNGITTQRDENKKATHVYTTTQPAGSVVSSSKRKEVYTKYHYNQLSTANKNVYDIIEKEILNFPSEIYIGQVSGNDLKLVFEAICDDNPMYFHLDNNYTRSEINSENYFVPQYVCSKSQYERMKRDIESKTAELISQSSGMKDEYYAVLAVHDYLIDLCNYNYHKSSMHDALIDKVASCMGFSNAAKYLLNKAGIECYSISGKTYGSENGHMWNVVKVNGYYYYLDVTWDEPSYSSDDVRYYTYMNITENMLSKTHYGYKNVNNCNSTKDNYFYKNNLYFNKYNDDIKEKFAEIIASNVAGSKYELAVMFADQSLYNKAKNDLFKDDEIYNVLKNAREKYGANINTHSISYVCKDEMNVFTIGIKR